VLERRRKNAIGMGNKTNPVNPAKKKKVEGEGGGGGTRTKKTIFFYLLSFMSPSGLFDFFSSVFLRTSPGAKKKSSLNFSPGAIIRRGKIRRKKEEKGNCFVSCFF
jgi:hypothetical protein